MKRVAILAVLWGIAAIGAAFVLSPSHVQACARGAVENGAEARDAVRRCTDLYRMAELRSR